MTGTIDKTLLEQARSIADQIINYRRHIHEHPELSFEEKETSSFVANELKKFGYRVRTFANHTGIIAELGTGERIIGIRADMDALPIDEETDCSFRSKNKGVMHACGHDAHTACGLGAARLLAEAGLPKQATVRMIFQPAEEKVNQAGLSGASLMIAEGAVQGLSGLIALHIFPAVPGGSIAASAGPVLAAADSFELKIIGKGCHAAMPELGCDAVLLATQAIEAIQTIVSRNKPATEALVITIGGIRSKTYAANIVAEEVDIIGTARYFNAQMHALCKEKLNGVRKMIETMGGRTELTYHQENPPLVNDAGVTEIVRGVASKMLGDNAVLPISPIMGAEDFSFYTPHVPSCYFVLGVGIENEPYELHSPKLKIDESALPIGSAILAQSALELMVRKG